MHQIHDLQPYHCTYEDCPDPNRIYGTRQEWLDHENQHRRVWHCQAHSKEFETQPDYRQHLDEEHPDSQPEDYSPELMAAVVGSSFQPHRDCPFCPTAFSDVADMQRHVIYHLERLALFALPILEEGDDCQSISGQSSDSHQVVKHRGRQDSIELDFTQDDRTTFTSFMLQELGPPQKSIEDFRDFSNNLTNISELYSAEIISGVNNANRNSVANWLSSIDDDLDKVSDKLWDILEHIDDRHFHTR